MLDFIKLGISLVALPCATSLGHTSARQRKCMPLTTPRALLLAHINQTKEREFGQRMS